MKTVLSFIQEKLVFNKNTKEKQSNKKSDDPTTWEVGDILSGTWGYNMTIPEFYKIVKKTPSGFSLIHLTKKLVDGHHNGSFKEAPDDSKLESDMKQKPKSCRIRHGKYIKCDNCYLHFWDGEPVWGNDMD